MALWQFSFLVPDDDHLCYDAPGDGWIDGRRGGEKERVGQEEKHTHTHMEFNSRMYNSKISSDTEESMLLIYGEAGRV